MVRVKTYTAKCLRHAATSKKRGSSPSCRPRVISRAKIPLRNGSSEAVSWMRPQRGSRIKLMVLKVVSVVAREGELG